MIWLCIYSKNTPISLYLADESPLSQPRSITLFFTLLSSNASMLDSNFSSFWRYMPCCYAILLLILGNSRHIFMIYAAIPTLMRDILTALATLRLNWLLQIAAQCVLQAMTCRIIAIFSTEDDSESSNRVLISAKSKRQISYDVKTLEFSIKIYKV